MSLDRERVVEVNERLHHAAGLAKLIAAGAARADVCDFEIEGAIAILARHILDSSNRLNSTLNPDELIAMVPVAPKRKAVRS